MLKHWLSSRRRYPETTCAVGTARRSRLHRNRTGAATASPSPVLVTSHLKTGCCKTKPCSLEKAHQHTGTFKINEQGWNNSSLSLPWCFAISRAAPEKIFGTVHLAQKEKEGSFAAAKTQGYYLVPLERARLPRRHKSWTDLFDLGFISQLQVLLVISLASNSRQHNISPAAGGGSSHLRCDAWLSLSMPTSTASRDSQLSLLETFAGIIARDVIVPTCRVWGRFAAGHGCSYGPK